MKLKTKIHAIAGGLAFLTIFLFWLSTIFSELFGSAGDIALVKTGILYGMAVLIPALMITGGSGFSLGRGWKSPVVAGKARRMKLIAMNGMLVLLPSAVALAMMARAGNFGTAFLLVQGLELIAGALNLTLIGMNMRAGMALRPRRGLKPA